MLAVLVKQSHALIALQFHQAGVGEVALFRRIDIAGNGLSRSCCYFYRTR